MNLYDLFFRPGEFFKNNKKFKNGIYFFIFFLILQVVAFSSSNIIVFNMPFPLIILTSIVLYVAVILAFSLILTFFLRIYQEISLKDTLKVLIYSLTPFYLTIIIISLINGSLNFIIREKPFIILIIAIYSAYLLHKGIKITKNMKSSFITAAIILAFVFVYILTLKKIDVILFYFIVMLWIYWKRNKFTKQGAILLYKTKLGLKSMDSIAKKCPRLLKILGDIGIGVGFLLMIAITYILIENAIKLLFIPSTMPGISPVLPGIPIPGAPIFLPLWYGIISIFITILVHEFSHGVIARVYNIKVKSSGLLFMGPIIGAFVEPDEKKLATKKREQLAVLGAGPFSNVLLAGLVFLILAAVLSPFIGSMAEANGSKINVLENTSAMKAGLEAGMIINEIDNVTILNSTSLYNFLESSKPNQKIIVGTNSGNYTAILGEHPEKDGSGYLGITAITNFVFKEEIKEKYGETLLNLIIILQKFLTWLFIISLGIGVANLIPLGPVDGGRMLLVVLLHYFPEEKAKKIWMKISVGAIILLLFVLFFPLLTWISGQFMV